MSDWFVDATISGGNGTDPASAFPSVLSIAWAGGDRAWVRKSHAETITNSQIIGQRTPSVNGYSRWHYLIGWPSAGDPFYDERPARGVTVGWDADSQALLPGATFGHQYPVFMNSGDANGGMLLGYQTSFLNATMASSGPGANNSLPFNFNFGTYEDHILDNILLLPNQTGFGASGYGTRAWPFLGGKIIITNSALNASAAIFGVTNANIETLVIHSLSRANSGGILPGLFANRQIHIGELRNHCGSIALMIDQSDSVGFDTTSFTLAGGMIERVTGVRPVGGFYVPDTVAIGGTPNIRINDYYGEGPRNNGYITGETRTASSGEALHNNQKVQYSRVASLAGQANRRYWGIQQKYPVIRKYFDVVSGTNITIYVPIYVDSTGVYSPTAGMQRGYMSMLGANPVVCTKSLCIPGSYSNWTGSLAGSASGSAWIAVHTFTPKETGQFQFNFFATNWFEANSGDGLKAYVLFGEPYAV